MRLERILFGFIALLSIFIMPWWTAAAVILVLLFRFTPYYEAFFLTLLLDAVQGTVSGFGFVFTFWVFVFFLGSLFIKDRMRIV